MVTKESNILDKSIEIWSRLTGNTTEFFAYSLSTDKVLDLYAKNNQGIISYLRMEILRLKVGLNASYGYFNYMTNSNKENPIFDSIKMREIENPASNAFGRVILDLVNSLNVQKELIDLCKILSIHSMDLSIMDEPYSVQEEYFIDYVKAIRSFYNIVNELKYQEEQVKVWNSMINSKMISSTDVRILDIQLISRKELEKYKLSQESIRLEILAIYATWYITAQALLYRTKSAKGLTVEQLIKYPVAYDISHMITETYLEKLKLRAKVPTIY